MFFSYIHFVVPLSQLHNYTRNVRAFCVSIFVERSTHTVVIKAQFFQHAKPKTLRRRKNTETVNEF